MVSIVKAHEQLKNYSLAKLVGIIRSHEDKVTNEVKVVSGMGSLALVVKGKKVLMMDQSQISPIMNSPKKIML